MLLYIRYVSFLWSYWHVVFWIILAYVVVLNTQWQARILCINFLTKYVQRRHVEIVKRRDSSKCWYNSVNLNGKLLVKSINAELSVHGNCGWIAHNIIKNVTNKTLAGISTTYRGSMISAIAFLSNFVQYCNKSTDTSKLLLSHYFSDSNLSTQSLCLSVDPPPFM